MAMSLDEVVDRMEIQDIYSRYVHAVDDRELEELETIFEADTIFDWTASGGERTTWSEAKTGDFITGRMFPYVFHVCVNLRIDFDVTRSTAVVKSKTIHPTGLPGLDGTPHLFQVQGAYIDRLTRREEGWRITERAWQDFWAVGGLELVDGIPGMLRAAGVVGDERPE